MNVLLTGAMGMVGQHALAELLLSLSICPIIILLGVGNSVRTTVVSWSDCRLINN